jgi:hypothetical protein
MFSSVLLMAVIAFLVFGLYAMASGLKRAEIGYEDEEGYHTLWKGNRPGAAFWGAHPRRRRVAQRSGRLIGLVHSHKGGATTMF